MKMIPYMAFGVILATFFSVSSQKDSVSLERWKQAFSENDEYLHALEVNDHNILENAKVLIHNLQTKKKVFVEIAKFNSEEIKRSLNSSEAYLDRLEKATDLAMDAMQLGYFADLHKHYRMAIEKQKAMQEELVKASPATAAIVMNAQHIYSEILKAGTEQIELERKMDIKVPEMQLQKN
jgi:hypothetical protein